MSHLLRNAIQNRKARLLLARTEQDTTCYYVIVPYAETPGESGLQDITALGEVLERGYGLPPENLRRLFREAGYDLPPMPAEAFTPNEA